MALGPDVWTATRARISALLQADATRLRDDAALRGRALVPMGQATSHLPFAVSSFSDF
jgi:fumarylacetoacetase